MDNQRVHNGFVNGRNEAVGPHNEQIKASATSLAIVKVKGSSRMVQMYAFLDNSSNASFCSEKLAKELNLNRKRTTLSLTTMEEDSKTDCQIVSLEVLDLDEENIFEVPITTESVANQQDVERW